MLRVPPSCSVPGRHTWTQYTLIHGHNTLSGTLYDEPFVANDRWLLWATSDVEDKDVVLKILYLFTKEYTITRELCTAEHRTGNYLTAPKCSGGKEFRGRVVRYSIIQHIFIYINHIWHSAHIKKEKNSKKKKYGFINIFFILTNW